MATRLLIFILSLACLVVNPSTAVSDNWVLRDGVNFIHRTGEHHLIFGNGVSLYYFGPQIEVQQPDGSQVIFNRRPNIPFPLAYVTIGRTTSLLPLAKRSRSFGWLNLEWDKLYINQPTPWGQPDYLNLTDGSAILHLDPQTIAIIDPNGPNQLQSIAALPSEIQRTLRNILSFHGEDIAKTTTSNIFSTEQLQSMLLARVETQTPKTLLASNSSKKENEVSDPPDSARASLRSFSSVNESVSALSPTTPDCCCPNASDGNTRKKKLLIILSGLFQTSADGPPHSSSVKVANYFAGSPCVETKYFNWSAYSCVGAIATLLKNMIEVVLGDRNHCSVEVVGYSAGGTIAAKAASLLQRPQGNTDPVHFTTLGSPFAASTGYAAGTYILGTLSVGTMDLASLVGLAPCAAIEIARGVNVANVTDPLTTFSTYYSPDDEWVTEEMATAGPACTHADMHKIPGASHDQLVDSALPNIKANNCCGDGNIESGEDCERPGSLCKDSGGNSSICSQSCTCPKMCGDGKIDNNLGEECDPPGSTDVKGGCGYIRAGQEFHRKCGQDCKCLPTCGDGLHQHLEECDRNSEMRCKVVLQDPQAICDLQRCKCIANPCPGVPSPECAPPGSQCVPTGPNSSGSGTCNAECRCEDNCVGVSCETTAQLKP